MNSKILAAFLGGALGASALVYVAMRPAARPPVAAPAPPASSAPAPPQPSPAAESTLSGETAAQPPITVVEHTGPPKPAPARVHRDKPVTIARNEPPTPPDKDDVPPSVRVDAPPPAPAPEPAPAPAPAPADAVQPTPAADNAPPNEETPAPEPNRVTLRRGVIITVRLAEAVSTEKNQTGDMFFATLDEPLTVDGFVIAERGARAEGKVVEAAAAGRTGGTSRLVLALTRMNTSDGQRVAISTATWQKTGEASHGADAAKVGGGAVLGAVIGTMAGGGKGAAIGAVAGGAMGAGAAVATHSRPVVLPTETKISFRVEAPVTITERAR